jgi:hypothetical protein
MRPVPGRRVRVDLGACEVACKRLNLSLILRELEVHLAES